MKKSFKVISCLLAVLLSVVGLGMIFTHVEPLTFMSAVPGWLCLLLGVVFYAAGCVIIGKILEFGKR